MMALNRRYGWHSLVLLGAVLCAVLPDAHAQSAIVVRKGAGDKTPMDWSGFTGGGGAAGVFVETLKNDLRRSGWFVEAARDRGEVVLAGGCTPSGASLRAECRVYGRVNQQRYLNQAFTAPAADPRRFAHTVADAIVKAVKKRPGMASGRIVLVGTRTGKKELYAMDSDGQGLIQLTKDNTVSVAPKWGPGNQIVYTSYLKRFPDVYLIDVTTRQRSLISNYPGLNTGADLSPDGSEVALILSKDGSPDLYIKDLRSSRLTRITNTRRAAEASPSWSPDGREIVYVSDQSGTPQLYVVSRGGGGARRLTSRGSENVGPDWGRGGLIVHCTRQEGRYQIAVVDPKTMQNKIVPTDGADYEDPSWAPDGRHIACTRTQNYRAKVYLLDSMDDPPIPLTNYPGDWYSPSWSP